MKKLKYGLVYSLCWLHAILPLNVLFVFSDILYYVVYYLVRYRRQITRKNLENAFPHNTHKEIIRKEKQFYQHFCDYFFETIKMLHISDAEMKRRMKFRNNDQLQQWMGDNRSCILMLGHYGNWEWVTSIMLWMPADRMNIGQIYRPLKDKTMDAFFLNLRKRFHSIGIAKNDTLRTIVRMKRENKQMLLGFMSDQKPSRNGIHYWTTFLNQETPVLTGVERIAKQTGFVVCYLDVVQTKRGYYEGEIKLITGHPEMTAEFEITEQYIRAMEQTILRNPVYWLWTHNRWKHKKSDEA